MRDNILIVSSGRKRIGKSVETLRQVLYQAYEGKYKRKSLIFDINNEYGRFEMSPGVYHSIKEIHEADIVKYSNHPKAEVRRIVPYKNNMPMNENEIDDLLVKVMVCFRGGILVVEDLNNIFGDVLPQKFSAMLCNNAHRNSDIFLHLQSIGRLLPKIRQNCDIVRFHHQFDDLIDSKEKLKGDYKILKIVQLIVNNEVERGNKYFFVEIYRDINKIKGQYSPRMLTEAIQNYLSENYSILTPLLQRRDKNGNKIYSYQQALELKTEELFQKYYGN